MKRKNLIISILKLVLAISVAFGHAKVELQLVDSRYSVNFFFIISGLFLLKSFDSGRYATAGDYTANRLRRMYPRYLFSLTLIFGLSLWGSDPAKLLSAVSDRLPEMFLVQDVGWFPGGLNYPLWFLCNLIIASHILFSLLVENRRKTLNIICPLIALFFGAYYMNVYNNHTVNGWQVESKFFFVPLLRTAIFLALGIMLCGLMPRFYQLLGSGRLSEGRYQLRMTLLTVFAFILWMSAREKSTSYLSFMVFLLASFAVPYERLGAARKPIEQIASYAERLSLQVFFNHALVIKVMNKYFDFQNWASQKRRAVVFLAAVMALSCACEAVMVLLTERKRVPKQQ